MNEALSRLRWLSPLAVVVLLAACGTDETPTGGQQASPGAEPPAAVAPGEPTPEETPIELAPAAEDEDAIERTVVTYFNALADRDYATACLQLGPEAQKDVASLTGIPGDCEDALEVAFESFSDQDLGDLRGVKVATVTIRGDTAEVQVEAGTRPVPLERSDGRWLISEFAGA